MNSALAQRPGSVTAVVFLTWMAALIDIVGGAVLVFFANNEDLLAASGASSAAVTASGWTTIAVGIVVAVVALRLGEGSSGARLLVTALMVLRVAAGIWVFVAAGSHGATESIVTVVLSAAVVYLLWSGTANDWFASAS